MKGKFLIFLLMIAIMLIFMLFNMVGIENIELKNYMILFATISQLILYGFLFISMNIKLSINKTFYYSGNVIILCIYIVVVILCLIFHSLFSSVDSFIMYNLFMILVTCFLMILITKFSINKN